MVSGSLVAQNCDIPPSPGTYSITLLRNYQEGITDIFPIDLDGDGDLDFLRNSYWDSTLHWHINDGRGIFYDSLIYSQMAGIISVKAEDIDRDGDPDILFANHLDNQVVWLENQNLSFTQHIVGDQILGAWSVTAVDMDQDGDVDILSASREDNQVRLFRNTGSEVFVPEVITDSAQGARHVYPADLDGDGDLDLISASSIDNKLVWYENMYQTQFQARTISDSATGARMVLGVDLDEDGWKDILYAAADDNMVGWLKNNGDKSFTEQTPIWKNAEKVRTILATDMDMDGDKDILAVASEERTLSYFANKGGGRYVQQIIQSSVDQPWAAMPGDFDGDGDLDLIFSSYQRLMFLEQYPQGLSREVILPDSIPDLVDIHEADLDLDGDLDFVAITGAPGNVLRFENQGDGTFVRHSIRSNEGELSSLEIADLNGDGKPDILVTQKNAAQVIWYPNVDGVTFYTDFIAGGCTDAATVFAEDVDGDGDIDVLGACKDKIFWYENQTNGFSFVVHEITSSYPFPNDGGYIRAGDLDQDGDIDIVASAKFRLMVFENNGFESFTSEEVDLGYYIRIGVELEDLDGDGDLDMGIFYEGPGYLAWMENVGNMQFVRHFISTGVSDPQDISIQDLDGDGDWDFVFAVKGHNEFLWFENMGAGLFRERLLSDLASGAKAVSVADYDGDGKYEILGAAAFDDQLSLFHFSEDVDKDGLPDDTDNCPGEITTGLDFDGLNDHVIVSNPSGIPVGDSHYTLEAWIYAESMGNFGIIGYGNYGNSNQVNALRLSGSQIVHYWWDNDVRINVGDISGKWQHVAATYDGQERRIYLNGQLIGGGQSSNHIVPDANNLTVGKTFGNEYFNGKLDEVRIWNVKRSQAEIQQAMHTELTGSEAGLVAYFPMNDGLPGLDNSTVAQVSDLTANQNQGVPSGFAQQDCQSNWLGGGPVQFLDQNQNGIGDRCEMLTDLENASPAQGLQISAVYPNPTMGLVEARIFLPQRTKLKIQLIDMTGRIHHHSYEQKQAGEHHWSFDLSGLARGLYLLRVQDARNQVAYHKILLK
ncbi:MAG: FG-GAP-like repeat-containing protein [Bacteroidota bacterium]